MLGKGEITGGDFALIFMVNVSINNCLFSLSRTIADFNKNVEILTHSLKIIEEPNETRTLVSIKNLQVTAGKIAFKNVCFNYGNQPLFENLSLTILPGQKVGLVGFSGGGKTTFINLLLRLYSIKEGGIFIDDQNIKEVNLSSLRKNYPYSPRSFLIL